MGHADGSRNPLHTDECVKPTEEENVGVRFVFGGNSRVRFNGLDATICGSYRNKDTVPVAFQGVKQTITRDQVTSTAYSDGNPAETSTSAGLITTFQNLSGIRAEGGDVAEWAKNGRILDSHTKSITAQMEVNVPAHTGLVDMLKVRPGSDSQGRGHLSTVDHGTSGTSSSDSSRQPTLIACGVSQGVCARRR